MPRTESLQLDLINNFADKIGSYATKYAISAGDLDKIARGRQTANWAVQMYPLLATTTTSATQWKLAVLEGPIPSTPAFFTLPTLPAVPQAAGLPIVPDFDVLGLIAHLAKNMKDATNYDLNDGLDLGIEGPEIPAPDPASKPVLQGRSGTGGAPEILWKKKEFEGIKLQIDRADGKGWVLLAVDMKPNFTDDLSPLPPAGTSVQWRYRAIYLLNDAEFGQWSEPVTVTVST